MLIVNDEHRIAAGIKSLSKRYSYCCKPLKEYSLIMNDDAGLAVFHAACAAALAIDIIVDLYTFFRPPDPTTTCLFLTHSANSRTERGHMQSTELEEGKHRAMGASVSSVYTGEVGRGAGDGSKKKPWATADPASWALVSSGSCDD